MQHFAAKGRPGKAQRQAGLEILLFFRIQKARSAEEFRHLSRPHAEGALLPLRLAPGYFTAQGSEFTLQIAQSGWSFDNFFQGSSISQSR